MNALKYSIVKSIRLYKPKEVIDGIYENTSELIKSLKEFYKKKIIENEKNLELKQLENKTFNQILLVLEDINGNFEINWDYEISFQGFKKYLNEKNILNFEFFLDKEGEKENTLNAAKQVGLTNVKEAISKDEFGIRISDMLAGVISKMMKAISNEMKYNSLNESITKKILPDEWFNLTEEQFNLYKKIRLILINLNDAWYKTYSGLFADDFVYFIGLLEYINKFNSFTTFQKEDQKMHAEYLNTLVVAKIAEIWESPSLKTPIQNFPIDFVSPENNDFFYNRQGAKIYIDSSKNPILKIDKKIEVEVLAVGFSKENIPLVTIKNEKEVICYKLPQELLSWVQTCVTVTRQGIKWFPTKVIFSKKGDKYFADII